MADTRQLLINLILYGLLPLWGITGFIDWICHRLSQVESTSGLKESLIHSLMGVQLAIPILLCLTCAPLWTVCRMPSALVLKL